MDHSWVVIGDSGGRSIWKCDVCGMVIVGPSSMTASEVAGSVPTGEVCRTGPGILSKAVSYSAAVVRWLSAGGKIRTEERQREIIEICKQCVHYNHDNETCGICGCHLSVSKHGWKSKLAMATERCPLDPPKWGPE